ncbi:LysM-like peptidoglycan-binding domain-containing protein [Actinobacillus delphinicola]|uniref:Opacity associated protein A n=1 Tax=Actinobacillus delphinicola TaxID=51161 RepID=A0A448TVT3_9PAST|nr:LysM-like peptidoglycan-binding domain-containing protein [Actinobacillus delphinicola]VEJ10042.1 opacity associated protein A [Actinobacillus delphinicola]
MLNDESNTQGIAPNKIPPKQTSVEEKNAQDPVADVSDHSIFDKPERELQNLAEREALENQDVVVQPNPVIQEESNEINTLIQENAAARSEDAEELKEEKPTLSPEPHFSHSEHDEELVYPEIKLKPRPENEIKSEDNEPEKDDAQTPPPVPPVEQKPKWLHPESWRCLQSMPPKYRRPLALLILIIIILIIISFLKPQAHSVQALEKANVASTTTSNSVITTPKSTQGGLSNVLDDANSSSTNTMNTAQNHSVAIGASHDSLSNNMNTLAPLTTDADANADTATIQTPDMATSATVDNTSVAIPTAGTTTETTAQPTPTQAENTAMRNAEVQPTSVPNNDVFAAAEKANLLPPVNDALASQTTGKTKVLVMHRGVSLMQIFRNHHLRLSDIIAMSKVGHHGRLLSELNPGDKVTVKLTPSRHVSELILPNGERFIRQANGSYIFTK